ncbi:hypothetical protein QBC32DRAFT_333702 [Pseudoneurospora amorphoporcata]|uniref:Secreted protein n=1 Tax=Pseudoneurospora amorphoporcata TaxID=241081 RepID=A0AAN6P286_9PEZI|nr:hypothetical protein QBC32DRAFT_333702 [Pseudoneurospora amorphoporcata]
MKRGLVSTMRLLLASRCCLFAWAFRSQGLTEDAFAVKRTDDNAAPVLSRPISCQYVPRYRGPWSLTPDNTTPSLDCECGPPTSSVLPFLAMPHVGLPCQP